LQNKHAHKHREKNTTFKLYSHLLKLLCYNIKLKCNSINIRFAVAAATNAISLAHLLCLPSVKSALQSLPKESFTLRQQDLKCQMLSQ